MGLQSVELCDPKFWPELKTLGLTCAIASSHGFAKGFAHTEEHAECVTTLTKRIDECAAAGVERVITFSGFRRGLSDEVAMKNMVDGLKKVVGLAEKKKVPRGRRHPKFRALHPISSRCRPTDRGSPSNP